MDSQPEPSASFSGVHRISIVERQTCMPLHDKVWVWKEDEVSPSTASKIIALFHQFARTVGNGDKETVVSVTFDTQVEQEKKFKKRHNYNNNANRYTAGRLTGSTNSGPTSVTALRQRSLASIRNVPMEMVCASNDAIIIAIFIAPDMYKSDPHRVARELLHDFMSQYRETLLSLKPIFTAAMRDAEKARNDLSLLPHFEKFVLPVFAASLPQSGPTRSVVSSRVEGSGSIILTSDEPFVPMIGSALYQHPSLQMQMQMQQQMQQAGMHHHQLSMGNGVSGVSGPPSTFEHGIGAGGTNGSNSANSSVSLSGSSGVGGGSGNNGYIHSHIPHHQHTNSVGSHAGFAVGSGKSNNHGISYHTRSLSGASHVTWESMN